MSEIVCFTSKKPGARNVVGVVVPNGPSLSFLRGTATVSSLTIAELFGKGHCHVLRDIQGLLDGDEIGGGLSNFGLSSYLNEQNKSQPMYELTRDGFLDLTLGYTG